METSAPPALHKTDQSHDFSELYNWAKYGIMIYGLLLFSKCQGASYYSILFAAVSPLPVSVSSSTSVSANYLIQTV